ncbi:MAG: hypothetical protein A2751_02430 [Candidatus Doudnabacteria bacterium RIFCSPHIGHO2_01_FULL_46_14]|uniref:HTH arsR-type domain-containing protein n=1 Tax=Candidatus Doudnabacteria bacterium RIFCSPHIGHO2_01_FULL_46_14 TaxID=1817824 RepID=A0A1F5NJS8_9BACT|nr:MAG: hypothetical protein A2751_02430 [Candidatus Doudnabacteria bacterium RIFCSPHIGHO2_01_FULL_46_14]
MIAELHKILQSLNLDQKETAVLILLLEEGKLRVRDIAKFAKINRTTAYGILKTLMNRGLVSQTKEKGVLMFQSIEPAHLINYVERLESNLSETKKEIKSILPQLSRLRRQKSVFPRIQFFEGIEGIKQAYEDTLINNEEKTLRDFTGTDAIFREMPHEWVEYYLQKRARSGIKCLDIAPDTEWSRKSQTRDKELLRETKLIPEQFAFDTEIDVYDNKTAIMSFSEKEPIAVIIEDNNIAKTMKKLFEYVYESITPPLIPPPQGEGKTGTRSDK